MSWEEIERSLDSSAELLKLLRYCRQDVGLDPTELTRWLFPELSDLPPMLNRRLYDWLRKQRFRVERSDPASITDMFRLMTQLAAENGVAEPASPHVIKCARDSISPYFNRDPDACIALLRSIEAECAINVISTLLCDLVKHYDQVLELGRELERNS